MIFIAPSYLLPPQSAVREHLRACMIAVQIPVGVYNNPSRLGVDLEVETLVSLARDCLVLGSALREVRLILALTVCD